MSFQDFFRGFMGINPRYNRHWDDRDDPVNKFRNPPWGDEPNEDDDFDELYSDYRAGPSHPFGFNIFTGDVMQIHKYFEEQLNEMMRSFGSLGIGNFDFRPDMGELPDIGTENGTKTNRDVRDRYLKTPLDQPRFAITDKKTDSDIDDRVTADGIGALFKKEPVPAEPRLPSQSHTPGHFSKSYTSRVIISNNGRREERVKEWSSDGVEREHVRRTLGDQSHSVTTSKDKEGQLRTEEELVNLDQGSLPDFDQKWGSRDQRLPSTSEPGTSDGSLGVFSPLLRLFS